MSVLARLAPLFRAAFALIGALTLMSCALVMSFDDYIRSSSGSSNPSASLYAVGGVVDGLGPLAKVTLTLNTADPNSGLLVGNGPFALPERLSDGQSYVVSATAPAGHTCGIAGGSGTIAAADVTSVAVRCASNDASLLSLSLTSGAALAPAFDPATLAYTAHVSVLFPPPGVLATARASGAKLRVNGVDVASGAPSAPITASTVDIEVTAPDSVVTDRPATQRYTIGLSPYGSDYLKASNSRGDALFGAVALSGDTLVVGSPSESSSATGINGNQADTSAAQAGAVYVFVRTPAGWSQQAYLKASNARAGARFGAALALSGDTLVVGSRNESSKSAGINGDQTDASAGSTGAAYVFTRTGGVWSQQAYIKASNARPGALFGASVALSGDTLVVGSPSESSGSIGINGNQADTSAGLSGAAYVFTRTGGAWSQQAYLKASNTRAGANFGVPVALSGDTLAVGSASESSAATGIDGNQADTSADLSGAAYVFTRTGGAWSQQAYVKASNTRTTAYFATSVALSGDTLAVGSPYEASGAVGIGGNQADTSAFNAGAAYVFTRAAGVWSQQAYVKASNTRTTAYFGSSIALFGDALAVGSDGESSSAAGLNGNQGDSSLVRAGAVYVFSRAGAAWSQRGYVKASNPRSLAAFSSSLALSADTLAVGSSGESSNAAGVNGDQTNTSTPGAGAVYVLR
jgi:hypothetical protein